MPSLSQKIIRAKLARYCEKTNRYLHLVDALREKEGGNCFGLAFLVLIAHRRTYSLKQNNQEGSWEQVKQVMTKLSTWDEESSFAGEDVVQIERFLSQMTALQEASLSHNGIRQSLVELCGHPTEEYSLAGYFTAQDFKNPITISPQSEQATLLDALLKKTGLYLSSHIIMH